VHPTGAGGLCDFINRDLLTEAHLIEIIKLSIDLCFISWLTTEQAWKEVHPTGAAGGHSAQNIYR